jgi:putative hemolysin
MKTMSKKNVLSIAIIVAIIFAAILIVRFSTPEDTWICENDQWIRHGNPDSPMPQSGCGKQNVQYDFSKTGNITNFDTTTQTQAQSWRFLYEEPGAPALSVLFIPTEDCNYYYLDGNISSCLDAGGELYNGQRIKMEGEKTDNLLKVARMYEQEVIQVANPASVYCQEQGGKIEIRETAEGQEGWCVFIDDRECDEWEFFRSQKCD